VRGHRQGGRKAPAHRQGQCQSNLVPSIDEFAETLASEARGLFRTDSDLVLKLYQHYCLLVRWNRIVKLTTVVELREAITRHYCESLFLASKLPPGAASLMDFGSGAGFPGVPIAAARPEIEVLLLERRRRKAAFLREATRGWQNVKVFSGGACELEQKFDWVVSRAVNPLEVITESKGKAKCIALLLGAAGAEALSSREGVLWRERIPVPWGSHRVVLLGEFVE